MSRNATICPHIAPFVWRVCELQVDLRFYAKLLTMTRISYLMVFMLLALGGQAQLSITASDSQVCADVDVTLQASGADLYTWAPATNLDTVAGDLVTFSAPQGSYTITITGVDTALNTTDTVMVDIEVWPLPFITINSSATPDNNFICLGDAATLTASGSPSIVSYMWTPGSSLDDSTASVVVASPIASTTYELVVTDSNGCVNTRTQVLNVNSNHPTLVPTAVDSSICPGTSTELEANGTGQNFQWSPSATLDVDDEKIVNASPATTTTYSVTATSNACETVETIEIVVLPAPTMSATQSSNGATIKLDEEDVITVTCPDCVSYLWKFPNSSLQSTSPVQTVSPNEPGAIDILISGFGDNGCKTTITVTVNVDSSFAGTPFGINETAADAFQVVQSGGMVNITADNTIESVMIYNLLGETVFQSAGQHTNSLVWNTGTQAPGVYVILARSGGAEVARKVYVQ